MGHYEMWVSIRYWSVQDMRQYKILVSARYGSVPVVDQSQVWVSARCGLVPDVVCVRDCLTNDPVKWSVCVCPGAINPGPVLGSEVTVTWVRGHSNLGDRVTLLVLSR